SSRPPGRRAGPTCTPTDPWPGGCLSGRTPPARRRRRAGPARSPRAGSNGSSGGNRAVPGRDSTRTLPGRARERRAVPPRRHPARGRPHPRLEDAPGKGYGRPPGPSGGHTAMVGGAADRPRRPAARICWTPGGLAAMRMASAWCGPGSAAAPGTQQGAGPGQNGYLESRYAYPGSSGAVLPVGQPERASVTQCQRSRREGRGRPDGSIHRAGMTLMRMPMTATGAWPLARDRPGAGGGRLARLQARARHTPALARRHWLFAVLLTAGVVLRILVQIAYRPALLYIDSTKYLLGAYPGGDPPV